MEYPRRRLDLNRPRRIFRPMRERRDDYHFRPDERYWRRQMGRPQAPFFRQYNRTAQQRARNIPFMTRAQFHATYGDDADFGAWLEARKYRPEDLEDPVVFEQLVYQRRNRMHGFQYLDPEEVEELHERDLEDDYLIMNDLKRQRDAEIAVEDLPVVVPGKKVKFED